jgi:hypothetical protein
MRARGPGDPAPERAHKRVAVHDVLRRLEGEAFGKRLDELPGAVDAQPVVRLQRKGADVIEVVGGDDSSRDETLHGNVESPGPPLVDGPEVHRQKRTGALTPNA